MNYLLRWMTWSDFPGLINMCMPLVVSIEATIRSYRNAPNNLHQYVSNSIT